MSRPHTYKIYVAIAAGVLLSGASRQLPARGPAPAPMVEARVDAEAYEAALRLSECMREFKALHREERRNPESKPRLDEEEKTHCGIPQSQQAIMARLRLANPSMGEAELQQEYQKTVIIAMLDAFKKSLQAEKTVNAPNQ